MDEHRRQEHDRGVEVQHGGHECDEGEEDQQQRPWPEPDRGDAPARRREQAVVVGDGADQEQPGDEREWRPRLRSRG